MVRIHRLLLSGFVCLALGGMVGIAAEKSDKPAAKKTPATQPASTQPAGKPINKFCAVDRDNEIDPSAGTVTYKGKVIGFCCEDCIPKFKKNPEKYMKDLK